MLQQLLLGVDEWFGFVVGRFGLLFERLQGLFQFVGIFFLIEPCGHRLQGTVLLGTEGRFGLIGSRFAGLAGVNADRAIIFGEVLIDYAFDVRRRHGLVFAASFVDF